MNNIEKAKKVVQCFSTGDVGVAKEFLSDDYVQHNLVFKTGKETFIEIIEGLNSHLNLDTTISSINEFEEGNYVVLHSLYKFPGLEKQEVFDVFRFENGKIVEHWDAIEEYV